jgi:hypothetical protein
MFILMHLPPPLYSLDMDSLAKQEGGGRSGQEKEECVYVACDLPCAIVIIKMNSVL